MFYFVLSSVIGWFKAKFCEFISLTKALFFANTDRTGVYEFFYFSILIASYKSLSETLNEAVKTSLLKEIIQLSDPNQLLISNQIREIGISYYLTLGVIVYISVMSLFLVLGLVLVLNRKINVGILDHEYFFKKMFLRFFYVWLFVFIIPNLLVIYFPSFISSYDVFWTTLITFSLSSLLYTFFHSFDFKLLNFRSVMRSLIIASTLSLGNYLCYKISQLPELKARSIYLAVKDVSLEDAEIYANLYMLTVTPAPEDLKKEEKDISIHFSKCALATQPRQMLFNESCIHLKRHKEKYERFINDQKMSKFWFFFPVEKYLKPLI